MSSSTSASIRRQGNPPVTEPRPYALESAIARTSGLRRNPFFLKISTCSGSGFSKPSIHQSTRCTNAEANFSRAGPSR